MSTRCNIHFTYGDDVVANIYRHCDGYPDGEHGVPGSLTCFFAEVEEQTDGDTRFRDPEYLAARFVVWQASRYAHDPKRPLNFLSLGVCQEDHGDIEYRYKVDCQHLDSRGRPTVTHEEV